MTQGQQYKEALYSRVGVEVDEARLARDQRLAVECKRLCATPVYSPTEYIAADDVCEASFLILNPMLAAPFSDRV